MGLLSGAFALPGCPPLVTLPLDDASRLVQLDNRDFGFVLGNTTGKTRTASILKEAGTMGGLPHLELFADLVEQSVLLQNQHYICLGKQNSDRLEL